MSIRAQSVTKVYHHPMSGTTPVVAVKEISVDINEGSYTIIFGSTGSGKTTLLGLLAGIIKPTNGEIIFHNLHLSEVSDNAVSLFREQSIGYIPQNTLLMKDLTVLENILSPNVFLKKSIKQLKEYALMLLEQLNLLGKEDFKPGELSGGENKKVMIARALLKKPKYLFADEPVSELDDDTARSVLNLFTELHKEGSAVVIASHKPITRRYKTDLYTMESGQFQEYTTGGEK
ncbi:MAG: ABC transporter ATP-binding protein [Spirochaetota bacterium]|nr:MAG: ABC transporter ATP-binding protein [Spirochaetota bacterium]